MPTAPVRSAHRYSLHTLSYAVTLGVFAVILAFALLFGTQLQRLKAQAEQSRTRAVPAALSQHARAVKANQLRFIVEGLATSTSDETRLQAVQEAEAILTIVRKDAPESMDEPLSSIRTSLQRMAKMVQTRIRYRSQVGMGVSQADYQTVVITGVLGDIQQQSKTAALIERQFNASRLQITLLNLRYRLSAMQLADDAGEVEGEENYYATLLSLAETLAARLTKEVEIPGIEVALAQFHEWKNLFSLQKQLIAREEDIAGQLKLIHDRLAQTTLAVSSDAVKLASAGADTIAHRAEQLLWVAMLALTTIGIGFILLVAIARREVIRPMHAASEALHNLTNREAMQDLKDSHLREVDEVNQALRQLGMALREAEEANTRFIDMAQVKNNFVSIVSHELRTPLTSMRGFSKLVRKEFLQTFVPLTAENTVLASKAERIIGNLDILGRESERLSSLINDVLDISRMESGRTTWHEDAVNIEELFRHTKEAMSGELHDKPQLHLTTAIEGTLPRITIDRDKLQQVLLNLLGNALKFTPAGMVRLSARIHGSELLLEVQDSGVGITAEDIPFIFEKFQQGRHINALGDKPHGTGLGLAISRQIIEHYGGQITVASEVGQGSTFTIHLPLERLKVVEE
jgi:signal transduction histidine kinase